MATREKPSAEHKTDLERVVEDALGAFWELVASRFPTAATGDLSPLTTVALDRAAAEAVDEWIRNNVPVLCTTCGSEIVETVNDSNFREGECGSCEYERYKRAGSADAELLKLARDYRDACSTRIDLLKEQLEDEHEFSGDATEIRGQIAHWTAAMKNCDTVLTKANGNAA